MVWCELDISFLILYSLDHTNFLSYKSSYAFDIYFCYLCAYGFRTGTCQREYESRAAVNTVVLHPNQVGIIIFIFFICMILSGNGLQISSSKYNTD